MTKTYSLIVLLLTWCVLMGVVSEGGQLTGQQATGPIQERQSDSTQGLQEAAAREAAAASSLRIPSAVRSFPGRVLRIGRRYVLQDALLGTTYDIDPQEAVRDLAGMTVRLNGTLDPSGNLIHLVPPRRQ